MLSNFSKTLTYITAGLYLILGALLFASSESFASVFAWKVTPFMTMFIGGWCLGNAWLAFFAARRWEWNSTYASLLYLWVFGIAQLLVVIAFRDRLQTSHPIAWLYLIAIGVNTVTALTGIAEWARLRPQLTPSGEEITTPIIRIPLYLFVLFLFYLTFYGFLVPAGGYATNGEIFPEPLTPFTLRSFGAFFLSLALGATPFFTNRDRQALLSHGFLSFGSIVAISVAQFTNLAVFNLAAFPLQSLFLSAYALVGIIVGVMLVMYGTGYRKA